MVTEAEAVRALHVCLSLALIGGLLWQWRHHRIDLLRDRLFALRDELFDYAHGHELLLHPAHEQLRLSINGMIRFAHKVTFLRLVVALCLDRFMPNTISTPLEKWREAAASLPQTQRKKFHRLHTRMMMLLVKHLITGSPVLAVFFVGVSCWVIVGGTIKRIVQSVVKLITDKLPGLDLLEAQALSTQKGV